MPVRCFECKETLLGWGTGRQHAQATGHAWQPGYYCPHCAATFVSHSLCKAHRKTCCAVAPGLSIAAAAATTTIAATMRKPATASVDGSTSAAVGAIPAGTGRVSTHARKTSITEIVSCTLCKEHFRDAETLDAHTREHTRQMNPSPAEVHTLYEPGMLVFQTHAYGADANASPEPRPTPKTECDVCKLEFTSPARLAQHANSVSACKACCICIPHTMMSLQDHYRQSGVHPTCSACFQGFEHQRDWCEHLGECPLRARFPSASCASAMPRTVTVPSPDSETPAEDLVFKDATSLPTCAAVNGQSLAAVNTYEPADADTLMRKIRSPPDSPTTSVASSSTLSPAQSTASSEREPQAGVAPEVEKARPEPKPEPEPEPDHGPYAPSETGRSSIVARAALDIITQRFGMLTARRVARVMEELGAGPAEDEEACSSPSPHRNPSPHPHPRPQSTPRLQAGQYLRGVLDRGTETSGSYVRSLSSRSSLSTILSSRFVDDVRSDQHTEEEYDHVLWSQPPSRISTPAAVTPHTHEKIPPLRKRKTDRSRPPPSKALSWHCRSCKRDPCVEPVATVCGHIFCRSCLVKNLIDDGKCPVCSRTFLVKLDVGVAD
ncbi:hypothetical protein C8Q78DRAFT_675282 [Trametes maxima]|nr:hypothetical protein C8Q78DRAFT_675282 [Trametes maxima]